MKKFLSSIMVFIFILSMVVSVYAATGNITASSSANTVVKGNTFTVTVSGTADSPIDGMYTKFTYDKNVLKIESAAPAENYGNNSSEGEILVTSNADTSPTSTTLYTITFKVLDTANVDSTKISFSESELHLKVDDTTKSFPTSIADVVINIKADDTTAGSQGGSTETPKDDNTATEDKENTTGNSSSKGNTSSNKSNNTNKSSNTKKNTTTKLPQTGVESFSVIAIVALGTIAIASYVSYRKYKNI